MHREYPWPVHVDQALQQIEQLTRSAVGRWIRSQRDMGRDDAAIHLRLALASARWVDHHGPFIGHGTFNGGPMLRAASILTDPYRDLALLQTAAYVVDLLHSPNYGPYLLMQMDPVEEDSLESSEAAFIESVESGEEALRSEHCLVGLIRHEGMAVHHLLTYAALRQFPENEHRLLIVHRAAQLLDDAQGWEWAEPILRPAVQYLATRPEVTVPATSASLQYLDANNGRVDAHAVLDGVAQLVDAPYGHEPGTIQSLLDHGMSGASLYEAVSVTSAELLMRSAFDSHAVTGIQCVLDLLRDPATDPRTRGMAWSTALLGQRTRRQKAQRSAWRIPPTPSSTPHRLSALRQVEMIPPV